MAEVEDSGNPNRTANWYVDPWRPVDLAIVTHAHADHARPGSGRYLASEASLPVLRHRLGDEAVIETLRFGEQRRLGEVIVSLHPAGHVLAYALAVGLSFPLLDLVGFDATITNAADDVRFLAVLYAAPSIVFKATALALMWHFPIDEAEHTRIREQLGEQLEE